MRQKCHCWLSRLDDKRGKNVKSSKRTVIIPDCVLYGLSKDSELIPYSRLLCGHRLARSWLGWPRKHRNAFIVRSSSINWRFVSQVLRPQSIASYIAVICQSSNVFQVDDCVIWNYILVYSAFLPLVLAKWACNRLTVLWTQTDRVLESEVSLTGFLWNTESLSWL